MRFQDRQYPKKYSDFAIFIFSNRGRIEPGKSQEEEQPNLANSWQKTP
jgi:hypothetical protein